MNAAQQTYAVVAEEWPGKKSKKWTEGHLEQNLQSLRDYVLSKNGTRTLRQHCSEGLAGFFEGYGASPQHPGHHPNDSVD